MRGGRFKWRDALSFLLDDRRNAQKRERKEREKEEKKRERREGIWIFPNPRSKSGESLFD